MQWELPNVFRRMTRVVVATVLVGLIHVDVARAESGATVPTQEAANKGAPVASPLTLDEVLREVDRSFPLLIAAARERDEAEGAALSAQGGFDPSLKVAGTVEPISGYPKQYLTASAELPTPYWGSTVFAGYRYGSGKIPIYEGKLETNDFGEVRAGARVPLWRDGPIDRRRASIAQGKLGVELAKLSASQQKIEARRLAALRYWDWVATGRRAEILRSWLALAVARDAGLATRASGGEIPDIDRVENQRTIYQRQTAVAAAERDLAQASMELSLFLRSTEGNALIPSIERLPPALPEPSPTPSSTPNTRERTEEEARALERRPDLKRLDVTKERNRIEADLARNQQKPAIDLTVFGARQFGPGEIARGEPVVGASLVLDIPILNRVQNGREDAAEAAIAKTEQQKRFAVDRTIADIRSARVAIDTARDRATFARRELEVATQLAKAELQRFELGEGNLLLVNLREQATAEAAIRQIDALADYHKATASYRASTAAP